jgi:hypothetical protein
MTAPTTAAGRELLSAPHVVEFSRTGYGLQHPISCRPNLIKCQMNRWLAAQRAPAMKPGTYLMAGPSEFAAVPKGWADPLVPSVVQAIEAEAVADAMAALRVEVEGTGHRFVAGPSLCEHRWRNRQTVYVTCPVAAVLALIDKAARR